VCLVVVVVMSALALSALLLHNHLRLQQTAAEHISMRSRTSRSCLAKKATGVVYTEGAQRGRSDRSERLIKYDLVLRDDPIEWDRGDDQVSGQSNIMEV